MKPKTVNVLLMAMWTVGSVMAEEPAGGSFADRVQPTSLRDGFQMEGYSVWGMSVIKGNDRPYHGFASRWAPSTPFGPNWVSNSEVVHAASKRPEGPYTFQGVALEREGKAFFDGEMTHNPTIHKSGDTYLLFYTGTTYDFPFPTGAIDRNEAMQARCNQRIGLATSKSPWIGMRVK